MVTPTHISNSKIIFSPLNWGMGHVSRSLPLLRELREQNNSITVFCTKKQQEIYELYFNDFSFIIHEPYAFNFDTNGFSSWEFIRQLPKLIKQLRAEKKRIEQFTSLNPTDYIISDQRYGFRSDTICSIFITHQCKLALPWYLGLGQLLNRLLIGRFNMIWIMDDESQRFAGKLSKKITNNQHYIGIKSRFNLSSNSTKKKKTLHVLLLNGPAEFHPLLFSAFEAELNRIDVIVGGQPGLSTNLPRIYSWDKADEILNEALTIYSFCGYSTLMDVVTLGCTWKSIPTPGQWEQEYLHKKTLTEGPGLYFQETND